MKKTIAIIGVVACALGVSSLQASPDMSASGTVAKTKYPLKSDKSHYYVTSVSATGSHIPLVVRKYKDTVASMSPTATYSAPQLDQTGQLNVGAQLASRDPAIAGFGNGGRLH